MGVKTAGGCLRRFAVIGIVGISVISGCAKAQQVPDAPAASTSTKSNGTRNFLGRWVDFYREDWKGTAAPGPVAVRRGLPSPLSSPPFPNSDWSYGGSPTIGEADGNVYPLQTAIDGATGRTKVYGWIEPTVNVTTSRDRNYPETNDTLESRAL